MGVTKIQLNGETLIDLSNDTATLADVMSGKTIHLSTGEIGTGTASAGIGKLIATSSFGAISYSSTSAATINKTMTVSGVNPYDLLIVETSVDSIVDNRHVASVTIFILTGTSAVGTKNTINTPSNRWNVKRSSGVDTSRQSTSGYGIYPTAGSISNGSVTLTFYARYNSTHTGTINGNYTARVYGVNLYDLIGG